MRGESNPEEKVFTMKKSLAAVCFLFVFVGSLANAQYRVYDFKASITRLDLQIVKVKYSENEFDQKGEIVYPLYNGLADTYGTAKDTLSGYLVVPICLDCCEECEGAADTSLSFDEEYTALFLTRKGDKTKSVWVFGEDEELEVGAALFNKGVAVRPDEDDLEPAPTSLKKLKSAWMYVDFSFEDCADDAPYGKLGDWPYGFLGHGSAYGYLAMTGFGKAEVLTYTTQGSDAWCGPSTPSETDWCFAVSSISGSVVGWVEQKPVCLLPAIWDVCDIESNVWEGVLNGTWSVKYNKKRTAAVAGATNIEDLALALYGDKAEFIKCGSSGY